MSVHYTVRFEEVLQRKLFSIALHVPIAHKRNMGMVVVFMVSVTPTDKAIQRQKPRQKKAVS